jgi:hypothetical protein
MIVCLALLIAASGQQSAAVNPARLTLSAPHEISDLDTDKLKGEPVRLAWSPDGAQLYLQAASRDRWGNTTVRHFLIPAAGGNLQTADQEPAWAAKYWSWKSDRSAPGRPAVTIAVDSRDEIIRATAAPRGGDLARGSPTGSGGAASSAGAGSSVEDAAAAANQSGKMTTVTLRLKGQTLGEWKNEPVVPGLTFGWAPADVGAIAFAGKDGRIVVMDLEGATQELRPSEQALLPAWSDDGRRLAFLQKDGKKRFTLLIVDVSR